MNVFKPHLAAGATVLLCCIAQAMAAPATLKLEPGQQKTFSIGQPIQRAATADGDIVGINVVPPSGVILTAKKPGTVMI